MRSLPGGGLLARELESIDDCPVVTLLKPRRRRGADLLEAGNIPASVLQVAQRPAGRAVELQVPCRNREHRTDDGPPAGLARAARARWDGLGNGPRAETAAPDDLRQPGNRGQDGVTAGRLRFAQPTRERRARAASRLHGHKRSTSGRRNDPASGDKQGACVCGQHTCHGIKAGRRIGFAPTGCAYPRTRKSRDVSPISDGIRRPTTRRASQVARCGALRIRAATSGGMKAELWVRPTANPLRAPVVAGSREVGLVVHAPRTREDVAMHEIGDQGGSCDRVGKRPPVSGSGCARDGGARRVSVPAITRKRVAGLSFQSDRPPRRQSVSLLAISRTLAAVATNPASFALRASLTTCGCFGTKASPRAFGACRPRAGDPPRHCQWCLPAEQEPAKAA